MHPSRVSIVASVFVCTEFDADLCRTKKSKMGENGKLESIIVFSSVKIVQATGEVMVQKPGEDIPKVFTFDSVYDWNSE